MFISYTNKHYTIGASSLIKSTVKQFSYIEAFISCNKAIFSALYPLFLLILFDYFTVNLVRFEQREISYDIFFIMPLTMSVINHMSSSFCHVDVKILE